MRKPPSDSQVVTMRSRADARYPVNISRAPSDGIFGWRRRTAVVGRNGRHLPHRVPKHRPAPIRRGRQARAVELLSQVGVDPLGRLVEVEALQCGRSRLQAALAIGRFPLTPRPPEGTTKLRSERSHVPLEIPKPFDPLRWFLSAVEVGWERAGRDAVRDFLSWPRAERNPARERREPGARVPGSVNAKTGKAYARLGYAGAAINHALSVMSEFYQFRVRLGDGPVRCPVPPPSRGGGRADAHHNPMEPFPPHRRGSYRWKQPDLEPRAVPDPVPDEPFGELGCNRDRALFSMFLSSGARAAQLLGMTIGDPRPGDGRVCLAAKGMGGIMQATPASPDAFAWLALYLGEPAQDGCRLTTLPV